MNPTVIDLYHGDTITSFEELAQAGIRRVIHKATEGETEIDPAYAKRQPEARAAGLQWEAYHFWRPDGPKAQAEIFLNVIAAGRRPAALWLDYEVGGGTPTAIVDLMEIVVAETGGAIGLYTTRSLAEDLALACDTEQKTFLAGCPLWIAEPGITKPVLGPAASAIWPKISLWQYTWSGKIAGVKGKCDLNCVPAA